MMMNMMMNIISQLHTRSHSLGSLGRTSIVHNMVLHVLRHGLATINTLLNLGVGNITTDNDRTSQREASLHGVLGDNGKDVLHGLVEINLHSGISLVLSELLQEATRVVLQLLHKETFGSDLSPALVIINNNINN